MSKIITRRLGFGVSCLLSLIIISCNSVSYSNQPLVAKPIITHPIDNGAKVNNYPPLVMGFEANGKNLAATIQNGFIYLSGVPDGQSVQLKFTTSSIVDVVNISFTSTFNKDIEVVNNGINTNSEFEFKNNTKVNVQYKDGNTKIYTLTNASVDQNFVSLDNLRLQVDGKMITPTTITDSYITVSLSHSAETLLVFGEHFNASSATIIDSTSSVIVFANGKDTLDKVKLRDGATLEIITKDGTPHKYTIKTQI